MQNKTGMKELLEQIKHDPEASFFIGTFQDHIEKSIWHYHQEYELSFITEGSGKRIVGDSNESFNPGDLIFIGPRIPHVWIPHDYHLMQHSGRTLESVYLLFNPAILPPGLLILPEFSSVKKALKLSQRGIRIEGNSLNQVSERMLQLPYLDYLKRLTYFYEIMDIIGRSKTFSYLASESYLSGKFRSNNNRISLIHEHLMKNYHEKVNLHEISELTHMAEGSICRLFKSETGLTIFEYLNKMKVDLSIQMLLHTDLCIEEISYDSGFNNLSHYNRQFKKITGMTPTGYRENSNF